MTTVKQSMKILLLIKNRLDKYLLRWSKYQFIKYKFQLILVKYISILFCNIMNIFPDKKNYDVLLIYPKSDNDTTIMPPHSLLTIAVPLIKAGYSVKIIDQRIDSLCVNNIASILQKGIICVGITFYTCSQIKYACDLMDFIKEHFTSVKIVAGGYHASVLPRETIGYKNIDIVVIGEGEKTLLDLVDALKNKKDLKDVKSIIYKEENGSIVRTSQRAPVDLNEHYEFDHYKVLNKRFFYPINTLFTTRGCRYSCSFCAVPVLYPQVRFVKSDIIISKIRSILKAGLRQLYFLDDNFFSDIERTNEILDKIIENDIRFSWWA